MAVKFSFEDVGKSFFGNIYRPIAKVSLQAPSIDIWTDTWMIIDTGADFSILPKYLANDLAISLKNDCVQDTTIGIGGKQKLFLCKTKIIALLGDMKRQIPLAFFTNNDVPPLLGRLGFLETFDVEFLKTHEVIFKN